MDSYGDVSSSGLRKRSGKQTCDTTRERSVSPTKTVNETVAINNSPMQQIKNELETKFPEIYFTDEFYDNEVGTTTCMVGGLTCHLHELIQHDKLPFEFKFEDGRLCISHMQGSMPSLIMKKSRLSVTKWHLAVMLLWLITLSVIVYFMLAFGERYNELWSSCSI